MTVRRCAGWVMVGDGAPPAGRFSGAGWESLISRQEAGNMSLVNDIVVPLRHLDRFFIDGGWVKPSTDSTIEVSDSATEERYGLR